MTLQINSGYGIGQPVRRKEDLRLVTGHGLYVADQTLPNMAHVAFVRSSYAHARITGIDISSAMDLPGVIAVFTGQDLIAGGLNPMDHKPVMAGGTDVAVNATTDFKLYSRPQPLLATDKARYIGEPVAMVIADSANAAKDAAELVFVDYETLPAVAMARDAIKDGGPLVWDDCASNICVQVEVGKKDATDAAFAKAAHIVRFDTWIQRVTGSPMEPRNAVAEYDPATQNYTLYAGTGMGVAKEKIDLAAVLGVDTERVRARCEDMGGNFGTRNFFFPEYGLLPWAAKQVGRPLKWLGDRGESFLSDYQGRDLTVSAELALDKNGKFLAVRGTNISNIGGHAIAFVPLRKGLGIMQGVYDIPAVHFHGLGVFTNTPPTSPYRSAGRPEAIYVIERLVDIAADEMGLDPVELRRRNLIQPNQFPYQNGVNLIYDNGEYEMAMDAALKLADWTGFPARRAEAKTRGKLRGIGIANYVEGAGGAPRERAEIAFKANDRVELIVGTMNSGQGHETSYAQLLHTWLGVPWENVDFRAHDTAFVKAGGGSHSGRSMRLASLAIGEAVDEILAKGKKIAGLLLQADEAEVEFVAPAFRVKGTDRAIGIFEIARLASERTDLPAELQGPFGGIGDHTSKVGAYPSGTHICEVEIDPDTGDLTIVKWSGVDDVGLAVNPMILHGQAHGAAAQGIGQALSEICHYDPENAQLLSGSFMDYAIPRAASLPSFDCTFLEIPATSHRFGIRPGAEGGTTPALGAVINSIVDALSEFGVRHVEMPATSERIWKAIQDAKTRGT